jgi:hypothetical protein
MLTEKQYCPVPCVKVNLKSPFVLVTAFPGNASNFFCCAVSKILSKNFLSFCLSLPVCRLVAQLTDGRGGGGGGRAKSMLLYKSFNTLCSN